jgi:hypothetical protein
VLLNALDSKAARAFGDFVRPECQVRYIDNETMEVKEVYRVDIERIDFDAERLHNRFRPLRDEFVEVRTRDVFKWGVSDWRIW